MEDQTSKLFTFLRGVCSDGNHPNTQRALGFARKMHAGQTRSSGEPYLIHPLSVACDAVGLGIYFDEFLATYILHDVPEETGIYIMDLPVSDRVKEAVECMTVRRLPGESKYDSKIRFYDVLINNQIATLGKGLDRLNNLGTMARCLKASSAVKNVYETHYLLQPILKEAKEKWPEFSNPLHTIRKNLGRLTDTIAFYNQVELPNEPPIEEMKKVLG